MKKLLEWLKLKKPEEQDPTLGVWPTFDNSGEVAWEDYLAGGVLFNQGKWEEAIPFYLKYLEYDPTSDQAGRALGSCYEKLGRYQEALAAYRTMKPHQWRRGAYRRLLADVLYKMGNLLEAQVELDKSLKADRTDYLANFLQGQIFEDQGRFAEAASHYRIALKEVPDDDEALEALERVKKVVESTKRKEVQ